MSEKAVLLSIEQRAAIENVIRLHAAHRGWDLHAVSVRSNHVHIVLTVIPKVGNRTFRWADGVKRVRDELKANATRVLRQCDEPLENARVWTKGGDIQFINSDEALHNVVTYVLEAQDRKGQQSPPESKSNQRSANAKPNP